MRLIIGFITYNDLTAKYLPYFLNSLKNQSFRDYRIIAVDNSEIEDNPNSSIFRKEFPDIKLQWLGTNMGFAKANNWIIKKGRTFDPEYILLLNPDMVLDEDMAAKLVLALDQDKGLGSVSPKILKWDFPENKKTGTIDTLGIKERGALRFYDIGQGEADDGQYDREEILGPSGAAAVYRLSALERVKEGGNYFDERMFMYKEDCDLAYRLKLAGFSSKCVVGALAFHDRTASAGGFGRFKTMLNRSAKSRRIRSWSFSGQHIIFLKHWRQQGVLGKIRVIGFAWQMFVFALFFEQFLLKEYKSLIKIKKAYK